MSQTFLWHSLEQVAVLGPGLCVKRNAGNHLPKPYTQKKPSPYHGRSHFWISLIPTTTHEAWVMLVFTQFVRKPEAKSSVCLTPCSKHGRGPDGNGEMVVSEICSSPVQKTGAQHWHLDWGRGSADFSGQISGESWGSFMKSTGTGQKSILCKCSNAGDKKTTSPSTCPSGLFTKFPFHLLHCSHFEQQAMGWVS